MFALALVAAATAAASAEVAGARCGEEGGACPATRGAEDHEETVLLAHKRLARELREELRIAHRRPKKKRGEREADGCQDSPAFWRDSHGKTCNEYVNKRWCTRGQDYGVGWLPFWGSFRAYATDGVDATEACCGCGGGTAVQPSESCHVSETADSINYGIDLYFHTDGSDTGCSATQCTPDTLLSHGVPKVIDAMPEDDSCACWASAVEESDDGTAAEPQQGERIFLFSYVQNSPNTCDSQTCWQMYTEAMKTFKVGYLSHQQKAEALDQSADDLLSPSHWVAQCEEMPEGARTNRAGGMLPVSSLVNALMSWDAVEAANHIMQMVVLTDDLSAKEVNGAKTGGSFPPPTTKMVIGSFATSWQDLAFQTAKFLLDVLTKVINFITGGDIQETVIMDTSFNTNNYFGLQVEFLVAGMIGKDSMKQWYLMLSNGTKVGSGPGPNTTIYYAWEDVKSQLESLGAKIEEGTVVRENELGMQVLNGALWPEAPGGKQSIFLGASREAHAQVRPLLADVLDNAQGAPGSACDGSTCWDAAWLREQARAWLSNRQSLKSDDLRAFVTKILHKVQLNIDLSDEEAEDFAAYKKKAIVVIPWPETLMASSSNIRSALQLSELQAKRAGYLERFKPAIQAKFPNMAFTEEDLALAAAAFLDSLQFAGGLSVPTTLGTVLALTHQREHSKWPALKGMKLNSSNIEGILWETMRLYPPVAGFPYWEDVNGTWHHKMPNVDMAMLDETVYEDPDTFKFRPLDYMKEKSIGWVDFATYPNGDSPESIRAPHSHRCPGKELSLQMMTAFLEEFAAVGPWRRKDKDIVVNAYGATPFELLQSPEDFCWKPASKCVKSFYYDFHKYQGCSNVDYHPFSAWCSHNKLYIPGQWSECTAEPGPCADGDAARTADAVDSTQLAVLAAGAECSNVTGSKKAKAQCVCNFANEETKTKKRVKRCADLSAIATELGAPYGCTVKTTKKGAKTCKAYMPWYKKASKALSQGWKSIKDWGKGLVPTSECYPTSKFPCSQLVLPTKTAVCSEVTVDTLSKDWLDMPEQLQGVFWLTEGGNDMALMSFGRSNDGAGMSQGSLGEDGSYVVRVSGDKTWSYLKSGSGAFTFAEATDLIYEFQFNDVEDPTSAKIVPAAKSFLGASVPPWLVSYNMTLVTNASDAYPGSVVWQKKAVTAGSHELYDYKLVQVINADGQKLPAFDAFVSFCEQSTTGGHSAEFPGKIWYRAYEMDPFSTSTVKQEMYRCPSVLGFAVPKIVEAAWFVSRKVPGFDIGDHLNDPPFDEKVYDEFTALTALGIIHTQLRLFGGAHLPGEERICLPRKTRPLDKVEQCGSLAPLEEIDLAEGECVPQVAYRFGIATMCGALIQSSIAWKDGMANTSDNNWERALKTTGHTLKRDHIMSFFEPFVNRDKDPIYPPMEFDWWGTFQSSPGVWEDALEANFVLDMLGTHLVEEVTGTPPSHGGETAALVIKLDHYSGLEVRPNFAPWGSNIYFTADGMLLGLERNTLSGTPEWVWRDAPEAEWQHAKFVFRSTLMNSVTAVDHLWFTHLSVATPLSVAARERLLPKHPLRRLLAAATFGTIDVNADAQQVLLGDGQVLNRAVPYKDWEKLHAIAREALIKPLEGYFEPFFNSTALAQLHPRLQQAPLYADGPLFMKTISDMIEGFFGAMGDAWCEPGTDAIQDQNVQDFADFFEDFYKTRRPSRAEENLKWLRGEVPEGEAPWTCAAVKKLLKCQLFGVSGFHQHVGKVADYVRDPEFVSISWYPGENSARPRQAMLWALISAATGYIGVPIKSDFSFMMQGVENEAALTQVLKKFQADLEALIPTIDQRNQARTVPYTRMHPAWAEISLYQ